MYPIKHFPQTNQKMKNFLIGGYLGVILGVRDRVSVREAKATFVPVLMYEVILQTLQKY
jgi:hypothetical protein